MFLYRRASGALFLFLLFLLLLQYPSPLLIVTSGLALAALELRASPWLAAAALAPVAAVSVTWCLAAAADVVLTPQHQLPFKDCTVAAALHHARSSSHGTSSLDRKTVSSWMHGLGGAGDTGV